MSLFHVPSYFNDTGDENMDHFLKERQPKRDKLNAAALLCLSLGFLSFITIIGAVIAPIFFLAWGIIVWIRAIRYPVIQVACPECKKVLKVEPQVIKFTCPKCMLTISKHEETWVV